LPYLELPSCLYLASAYQAAVSWPLPASFRRPFPRQLPANCLPLAYKLPGNLPDRFGVKPNHNLKCIGQAQLQCGAATQPAAHGMAAICAIMG
jgi:hypothetical protein